ncbi:major outer membrane lipoprotein [Xenorhabdus vietnamensis]|uniref:Major outer membrane lipoprotein Lpp n=1 Tax=Xenorhabdus vietnamensis TaxID=351656 RepID=A0A1Y2SDF5_9GAMM|nr:major outer membrane lipoprotein [Xenorhabdus vietnamensis]OTA15844.1 major outer membrane lipoprotein [Xenorhabdus vietnamensis]
MNRTKVVFGAVILASTLLAGCSNATKVEQLASQVHTLGSKVDRLSSDISSIRSEAQSAKDEAARANQRLNNQVRSYKK